MTEAEWRTCSSPKRMLTFLQRRASDRKLRLFAVACCGRIGALIDDPRSVGAVRTAEQYADGLAMEEQRGEAARAAQQASARFRRSRVRPAAGAGARQEACAAAAATTITKALLAASRASEYAAEAARIAGMKERSSHQASLLRDLFDNLFRHITIAPTWLSWHDGLPRLMALRIYETRNFTDLPVLADALEEAGCDSMDILDHCRQPGEHVRGCWVIDLILGKE